LSCLDFPAVPAVLDRRPALPADLTVSHGELGYATGHTTPAGFYSKLDWQIQGGTGPALATSLTVESGGR
jgi:hypothetical protein